jgi:hypothetical protein
LAENEDPADAASRLEEALERIAQHSHKLNAHRPLPVPHEADTARIAARLDALIAQLRAALGAASGP